MKPIRTRGFLLAGLGAIGLFSAGTAEAKLCLFNCKKDKVEGAATPETEEFAKDDFAISDPSRMSPIAPDQYYVRLVIATEFEQAALTKLDKDTNSRWRRLTKTDTRGYSVVSTLVVQDGEKAVATIAPKPILTIALNTAAATATEPLSSRQVQPFTSGWMVLGPGQTLTLQLSETAQNDAQWQALTKNLGDASKAVQLFTPLAVPESAPSVIDGLLNKFLGTAAPGKRVSARPLTFDPTGSGEWAYNVEYRDLTSPDKPVFARSKVVLHFTRSRGGAPVIQTGVPANDPVPRVNTATPISALTLVPVTSPTGTLASTTDWTAIQNAANATPNTPASFAASCDTFRSAARRQAGMTRLDANLSLLEALHGTQFRDRVELVRSACFTRDDRTTMAASGHPVPATVVDTGDALLLTITETEVIGKYLRSVPDAQNPGFDDLLKAKVATELVTLPESDALNLSASKLPARDALGDLRSLGVDRFCCINSVTSVDPATGATTADVARRQLTLLVADKGGTKFSYVQAELSTTKESVRKLGRLTLRASSTDEVSKARAKFCATGQEAPPSYLGCAAATTATAAP